ncbi:uncharacterized protein LOC127792260 [Diospyros lotus]|uniref:uncharacterized protein LOC127792260 n=1 Tax=Diospyros lotus TaxID=55363 RepID=UPI0022596570|nr:uncharacterized protein LOC127792260 [Diospyros lotus]
MAIIGSGRFNPPGAELIEWEKHPAASIPCQRMSQAECQQFREKYNVPEEWEVEFNSHLRACHPVAGRLCIYKCAFDRGFRLPPRRRVMTLLQHLTIAPAQLSPFGWRYLMGFLLICHSGKIEPTGDLFDYFFTTNRDPGGWISISPRIVKDSRLLACKGYSNLEISASTLMQSGGSKDSDDWKERFVFVRPRPSGSSQEIWSVSNEWTLDTKHKRPSVETIEDFACRLMKNSRNWEEGWLSNPSLSQAGLDGENYEEVWEISYSAITKGMILDFPGSKGPSAPSGNQRVLERTAPPERIPKSKKSNKKNSLPSRSRRAVEEDPGTFQEASKGSIAGGSGDPSSRSGDPSSPLLLSQTRDSPTARREASTMPARLPISPEDDSATIAQVLAVARAEAQKRQTMAAGRSELTGEASLEEASVLSAKEILARRTKRRRMEAASPAAAPSEPSAPKATNALSTALVLPETLRTPNEIDYCAEILRNLTEFQGLVSRRESELQTRIISLESEVERLRGLESLSSQLSGLEHRVHILTKSVELAQEDARLANEAEAQAREDLELVQKNMLEANQANSRLGEELDSTKVVNRQLQEDIKRLTLELKEAKKGQVEALESYSRCKEDLRTAHAQLQSALKDAQVAFQNGREDFRSSEAYAAELEGVLRGGFEHMRKLIKERFPNLDVDSIPFDVVAALSSLE